MEALLIVSLILATTTAQFPAPRPGQCDTSADCSVGEQCNHTVVCVAAPCHGECVRSIPTSRT